MGVRGRVLAALGVALLAGCGLEPGGSGAGETSSPPLPSYSGTADGTIDRIIGATDLVDVAPHALAQSVAVDATGAPVVFLQGVSHGDPSLLARVATDGGWTSVPVPAGQYAEDLEVATDGSLVATSHDDDVITVARGTGGGMHTVATLSGRFGLGGERPTALSPDGATLYLPVFEPQTDVTTVFAVDLGTGSVTAHAALQPGDHPQGGIRVASNGDVLVAVDVALGHDRFTAVLDRFDAGRASSR